jgi:ribosomal protein S12 methylthiotransferase accessory factor
MTDLLLDTAVPASLPRPRAVAVLGQGRLRTVVEALLARRIVVGADLADGQASLVVVASDGWDDGLLAEAAARFRAAGTPWLPVHVELGQAVIGPLTLPGRPGGHCCADRRRRAVRPDAADRSTLLERHGGRLAAATSSWLTGIGVQAVATIVADAVCRVIDGDPAPALLDHLMTVRLDTLATRVHRVLPDPRCPECGRLPADSADDAALALASRPKLAPGQFRAADLGQLGERIEARFVDAETGLVREVIRRHTWSLPVAFAPLAWPGVRRTDHGVGRTLDHRSSGYAAVLEALERYAGLAPGRRRGVVRACYGEVSERALDPRRLGLPAAEQYASDGFPYQPFTDELQLGWVWGFSFARRAPLLIPECFVYYGHAHRPTGDRPLAYETSNGCALGSCLEEAILYGILEVAERDAFLMTWYAQMPVPRIAIGSARDRSLPLMVERVERLSGYRIGVFDITVEHGVPSVWAMAENQRDDPDRPTALCAAGAHLDPEKACLAAIGELALMIEDVPKRYLDNRDRVRRMVNDPDEVRQMEDHSLLYGDRAAFERLAFLLRSTVEHSFGAELSGSPPHADLRDDVTALVDRYLATGLDVIVVNQTTPELAAAGLACAKTLIPGLLPMTFGHRNRRTHGLSRPLTVPVQLGYADRPLRPDNLNPHPHPFP